MPIELSSSEVEAQIKTLSKWDVCPTLTQAEIDLCVAQAKRTDQSGYLPTDSAWTPTWDIAAGVAFAWELKAGNAAGDFDFAPEAGVSFKASQVEEMCLKQADRWRQRIEPQSTPMKVYEDLTVAPNEYPARDFDWTSDRLV